jgi:hypothetical protein
MYLRYRRQDMETEFWRGNLPENGFTKITLEQMLSKETVRMGGG